MQIHLFEVFIICYNKLIYNNFRFYELTYKNFFKKDWYSIKVLIDNLYWYLISTVIECFLNSYLDKIESWCYGRKPEVFPLVHKSLEPWNVFVCICLCIFCFFNQLISSQEIIFLFVFIVSESLGWFVWVL